MQGRLVVEVRFVGEVEDVAILFKWLEDRDLNLFPSPVGFREFCVMG